MQGIYFRWQRVGVNDSDVEGNGRGVAVGVKLCRSYNCISEYKTAGCAHGVVP